MIDYDCDNKYKSSHSAKKKRKCVRNEEKSL